MISSETQSGQLSRDGGPALLSGPTLLFKPSDPGKAHKKNTTVSIIVPAHNEERTIAEILRRILLVDLGDVEKEIIVIDNNSTDSTFEIASSFKAVIVHREYLRGKGAAVKRGFKVATGDYLLIQDADLEYDPEDYPALIRPLLVGETVTVHG